jgi:hypothetical protein
VGLWTNESSSLKDLPGSMFGVMDGLDLVVARDVLEAFNECLPGSVATDELESRDGGSASGKLGTDGDCSLDDGTETTRGDDTAVPPGLRGMGPDFVATFFVHTAAASPSTAVCSLMPPTDALKRL